MRIAHSGTIVAVAIAAAASNQLAVAQVSADDFLPPVRGGPTEVKQPAAVKVTADTVTAASPQDAMNAAVVETRKGLVSSGGPDLGTKQIAFPSGSGFLASGLATYRVMDNPTATRIAKRQAYVIAFTQAKKNLAEHLGGLTNEGKDAVRQSMASVNTADASHVNLSQSSDETLKQSVDMMLRGFVVYEVADDPKTNSVLVSIVTTPKTRGQLARPTPATIEAGDLRAGLDQVIAEVRGGLVAPVGGRVVTVPATGETAFVGFGSSVVSDNENAAVQQRLNLESEKVARMRAQDALCGLIIGDQNSWQGTARESMRDEVRGFEPADDPLKPDAAGGERLAKQRQTFVSKTETTDDYASARKGVLPPGITVKTWTSDDKGWAMAMAVYLPSATNAAAQAAGEMSRAKILQPVAGGDANPPATDATRPAGGDGFRDGQNPNVARPDPADHPGPTTRANNGDL